MKKFRIRPVSQQVIVITGASSGIGLATAIMAADRGAKVVLTSRNEEDLKKIVKTLRLNGGKAISIAADVSKLGDVEKIKDKALSEFGRIDTWVNNAGVSIYGYLTQEPLEEEKQLFETNFWGVRHGCRVAIPVLSEQGGVLINVGSELSTRAIPLQGMYSASKHAVKAYTDALRMEMVKKDVPVAVCLIRPAGIDTPYTEHARNELPEGEPSLPDPVYHPNIVARAILNCAQDPQRDIYIGAPSRLFTILEVLAPRWVDRFMQVTMFNQQSRGSKVRHSEENEGLMHAPRREGRVTGGHRGKVFNSSMYATAQSNHVVRSLAFLLMGIAAYGMMKPKPQP